MSDTPTLNQVVLRLAELSRMLDAATDEIARLDEDAVRAKGRYQVAYARAFLGEAGAMDVRKQNAVLVCEQYWLDAEIAEQKVRACKERIRTIRDQIEVGRSLNSAVKAEWSAGSVGQVCKELKWWHKEGALWADREADRQDERDRALAEVDRLKVELERRTCEVEFEAKGERFDHDAPRPDATRERLTGTQYIWRVGGWSVTAQRDCGGDPHVGISSGRDGLGGGIGFPASLAREVAQAMFAAADRAEAAQPVEVTEGGDQDA